MRSSNEFLVSFSRSGQHSSEYPVSPEHDTKASNYCLLRAHVHSSQHHGTSSLIVTSRTRSRLPTMSDLDATTPRVFLARHGKQLPTKPVGRAERKSAGETEWTKNGRYTGITDLDLTPEGVKQTTSTAAKLVGHGRLIDPARLVRIWVSPRRRAKQTFNSLFGNGDSGSGLVKSDDDRVVITEDIAEWGYGDYEGMRTGEVKKWRKERGLDGDREWSIWRDGCEGGE